MICKIINENTSIIAMMNMKNKIFKSFCGFFVGVINSLLGAGGGMIAVPLLRHMGLSQKEAHASAIAVILPLTAVSAGIYILTQKVTFSQALPYIPAGLAGSLIGSYILPKIPENILRKVFAIFMLWAGIRMLLR